MAGAGAYGPPSHALPQLTNHPAPSHERGPSGGAGFSGRGAVPAGVAPGPNGPNGAPGSGTMPPYHRPFTPPAEITPIRDERPPSPHSTYPHQQYHPGPSAPQGSTGIAGGAPPPASAIAAAELAAREREDRPASAMKRAREWEADAGPVKKVASEESRARLDDQANRHVTPPNRLVSPGEAQRRNSSEAKREEQQHQASENYHPSAAAHHPPTLPPIQHMPQHSQGSNLPPMAEVSTPASNGPPSVQTPVKEEASRGEQPSSQEPAARKMEVDEDYDDDDDEQKARTRGSPQGNGAGNVNSNGVVSGGQTPQSKQES